MQAVSGLTPPPTAALAWLAVVFLLALATRASVEKPAVQPRAEVQVSAVRSSDEPPSRSIATPRMPPLSARMRNVLAHTAKRYRLSPMALEPAFVAAEHSARDFGLDPLLVVAVIGIESGFNPFAESVVGAQGLMQIIPRYHADKLPPEVRNGANAATAFFDPVVNVRVGVRALHEFIHGNGDIIEGLQQFAGAPDDPEEAYAAKVLAEVERLEGLTSARISR